MASKKTEFRYNIGDRVLVKDEDGSFFKGKIVGRGPRKMVWGNSNPERLYDVKREDGAIGAGIRNSWRLTHDETFGGKIVRKLPPLKKAG